MIIAASNWKVIGPDRKLRLICWVRSACAEPYVTHMQILEPDGVKHCSVGHYFADPMEALLDLATRMDFEKLKGYDFIAAGSPKDQPEGDPVNYQEIANKPFVILGAEVRVLKNKASEICGEVLCALAADKTRAQIDKHLDVIQREGQDIYRTLQTVEEGGSV
jgi:hypothetical protein